MYSNLKHNDEDCGYQDSYHDYLNNNEAAFTEQKSDFANQIIVMQPTKGTFLCDNFTFSEYYLPFDLARYTAVDRYASVSKPKPKNTKPEVDFGDTDLEIYDGDSFSVYNTPNNYNRVSGFKLPHCLRFTIERRI